MTYNINYYFLVLKLAFKQGFRWQPASFPVSPTPLDAPPVSVWSNPRPIYPDISTSNTIPTGVGIDALEWDKPDVDATPVPWSTGPVPSLEKSKTARPSTRKASKKVSTPTKPKPTTTTSTSASPKAPSRRSNAPAPFPRITVAPVALSGVPGSSHRGIDMVNIVVQHFFKF